MEGWRDHILLEFAPKIARLTLVADPDSLLLEEGIMDSIRQRGFEVMPFEDPVTFRYVYESGFRSRWERGAGPDLIVTLRSETTDLGSLPYDLFYAGRRLSFRLADIFPHLSCPVVDCLDRADLDDLYKAQEKYAPGPLSDNATKDFILRHVFETAPEMIKEPKDLLRVLIRRHYRRQVVPVMLDEYLIQLLRQIDALADWPLEEIVADRDAFFAFLQERWPAFLDRLAAEEGIGNSREAVGPYTLALKGPVDLPFDDRDVQVYLDRLFLERILRPQNHDAAEVLIKTWAGVGVRFDPVADRRDRLAGLIDHLRSAVPPWDARFADWLRFARAWAEVTVMRHQSGSAAAIDDADEEFIKLQARMDAAFAAWLTERYAGLINLPPGPPPMLHHVPRYLARLIGDGPKGKVALLVMDGLSLDQWLIVREALLMRQPRLRFRESAVFAWMPTITSVSRQSVFAGRAPVLFPDSIGTTAKEPVLWKQFWAERHLASSAVAYVKGLGEGDQEWVKEIISDPQVRVAGLVIDIVDKIMHGMKLGMAGMHNQVRQWAGRPYLSSLLELLLDNGFRIFLTSDHGNVEAQGCGRPGEGSLAVSRGERVRLYNDAGLRESIYREFPAALQWKPIGLPGDLLALVAPTRQAFVQETEHIVTHGGNTVEEVIVPLVQIERVSVVQTWAPKVSNNGFPD